MSKNYEAIKAHYAGSDTKDLDAMMAPLTATTAWTEMAGFPCAGTYVGVPAIIEGVFKRLGEEWDGYNFKLERLVDGDGTIVGTYSNTQSMALGQVALANFNNVQGLIPQGNNLWQESAASGIPIVGVPGGTNLGKLQSGAVEASNVDLTAELVHMITAQRNYQASAQTIKTEDQLMQTMVNL